MTIDDEDALITPNEGTPAPVAFLMGAVSMMRLRIGELDKKVQEQEKTIAVLKDRADRMDKMHGLDFIVTEEEKHPS